MKKCLKQISCVVFIFSFLFILTNFTFTNNKFLWQPYWSSYRLLPNEYRKYVLYECSNRELCGGLVDRFKGIMNAYAWSLFTDRYLIIKITKPCYFERLLMPNEIDWNLNLTKLIEIGQLPPDYSLHEIRKLDKSNFKTELTNIDIPNYEANKDVISLFANIEWISAYAKNK